MPANDGSNITIAGPRGGLTTTDPFQQASRLFSAMRRASGGGGDSSVAAALGLPPNAKIDYMLDPRTGAYVPVVGGTDELRKHNLEAAKQRRALQAFETKDEKSPAGIIKSKLEGFAGKSAEKQASILNDIRTNDIPKLSQASGVSGSDLITYGLADYTRMQGENAANVARVGVGDILWDSARIGVRNFMDSVADIFSDSQEQLARANTRQQYIRDIQDSNAFLRNRALQQREGAGFMDRFGIGELAATTGEFLAENAPVLAATALTGGAAGLAARGLGAAAATAGRASMLGSAVGGGLTGMPTQLGSAINEIAGSNMTKDQKLQALDEAYGPSLRAGAALGAVVMPFGQYISRGIGSGLARAGVGNSNVAKMVRSRRANEALPTGTNNWDEAMAMARRNDILAENEAVANQGFISGMIGRRLRDSAIEGSLLSGASQMATNAAVGNDLMENVGPATIGGAIGGALFTPFNRRTAMGVPEDVIGPRTTERQKLAQLLTNINAERAGDTVSREDQILNAMDAWNTAAGFRGDALFDSSRPMTPEQYDAYVRQQQHDDLLLNRMMAHEQAMQERANNFGFNDIVADPFRGYGAPVQFGDRTATAGPRIIDRTPPPLGRYDALASEWNRVAAERAAQLQAARDAALDAEFAPRSIFDVMPEPVPYTPPSRITRSVFSPDERLAQEWDTLERARAAANLARQARTYPVPYTPMGVSAVEAEPTPEFVRAQVERQYGTMAGYPYSTGSLMESSPVGELPPAGPRALAEDPSRNRWEGGSIPTGSYGIFVPQDAALPLGTDRATAGDFWVGPSLMDIPAAQSIATERARRYPATEGEFRLGDITADNPWISQAIRDSQVITTPDLRSPEEIAFTNDWFATAAQNQVNARTAGEAARQRRLPAPYTSRGVVPVADEPTPEFVRAQVERQYGTMAGYPYSTGSLMESRPAGELPPAEPRALAEDPSRNRWEGGAIPQGESPTTINERVQRLAEQRQQLVDVMSARGRQLNERERHDFTIYEGEVLLENNPGVLPANNYLPENVAAVAEHLGEPRTAETMLDGTPATDQRPQPQRPYTKAITYVSSDEALNKFTGKLRGRESMIPRDVREEQMGWMNDILAAGTGKGRISAQGVLAKDVQSTLDNIVDSQTVDGALRLDELLLTRLRGSEGTSLFNRAQRAAMQYVRNRIYTTMDDYAYRNKLGRYGETNANNPENPDPTSGGGSPTSGMGRADTAGAEQTADANLSDDSGKQTDTAGASEAIAGQLPVSPAADSAAVKERGDAGAKASGAGENQKVEGDSAAETAQQQTANGKRGAGNAARVDAAANQSAGGDRLEGGSEQSNDRDAADTGSNEQSGRGTEPEDGEPVEVEHTDDWPWGDIEEERSAREEIHVNKKTGEIGFSPNRLHDGYDEWNTYGVRDMFVPKREKADPDEESSPTSYITFKNANGDTYELSFDFYRKQGNIPAHWSENTQDTPGVRIDDKKNLIWVNLKQAPEELQRAASGFEARVEITLKDDENSEIATSAFPLLPEEYPLAETPEARPATQNEAAPTTEQTPDVEPKGLSSAEEIAARQANPDRVPTEGVDPESNEALAWAARQQENRTHVEDDDPNSTNTSSEYGSEYRNLTGNNKQYKALNIRSSTSKTQISVDTTEPVAAERVKVFPGYIRIMLESPDTNRKSDEISIAFRIKSDKLPETSYTYAGIYKKENGDSNTNWRFEPAPMQEEFWYYMRNGHVYGESRGYTINKQVIDGINYKFKGYAITNNLDKNRISTPEDTPKNYNEYAYIHLDNMEELLKLIPNDDTASFNVKIYPFRDNTENKFNFSGTLAHNELLNPAARNTASSSLLDAANIKPTKQNIEAAQKVVKEGGSVDTHEAFSEDAAPANVTITTKDSLKANTKKKIQKAAAQNLPQLPMEEAAPTTDSPAVFSERFSRTIDDMERQYTRNNNPIDGFVKGAASSAASAKRIIAKRNASDASWKEDLRNDMAETAARIGIMRSTGLFGEIKRGSPLAKKEEFYRSNNIPLIAPNSDMARHLREYFSAMPARERKITQAIDYVLRDPATQKFDIIDNPTQGAC